MSFAAIPPEVLENILYCLISGPDDWSFKTLDLRPTHNDDYGLVAPIARYNQYQDPTPQNIFLGRKVHTTRNHAHALSAMLVCKQWYLTILRFFYEEVDAQPYTYSGDLPVDTMDPDEYEVYKGNYGVERVLRTVPRLLWRTLLDKTEPEFAGMIKRLVLGTPHKNRRGFTKLNIDIIDACKKLEDLKIFKPSPHRRQRLREILNTKHTLRSLTMTHRFRYAKPPEEIFTLVQLMSALEFHWPHMRLLNIEAIAALWEDHIKAWKWIKSLWARDIVFIHDSQELSQNLLTSYSMSFTEDARQKIQQPMTEYDKASWSSEDVRLGDERDSLSSWSSGTDIHYSDDQYQDQVYWTDSEPDMHNSGDPYDNEDFESTSEEEDEDGSEYESE